MGGGFFSCKVLLLLLGRQLVAISSSKLHVVSSDPRLVVMAESRLGANVQASILFCKSSKKILSQAGKAVQSKARYRHLSKTPTKANPCGGVTN
jgi:hypothetical protein